MKFYIAPNQASNCSHEALYRQHEASCLQGVRKGFLQDQQLVEAREEHSQEDQGCQVRPLQLLCYFRERGSEACQEHSCDKQQDTMQLV